ncbi:MAG: YraN family protein [Patescibacteria group bacterium]|nr:YraN family protein [Patescibacteria group bacterium]
MSTRQVGKFGERIAEKYLKDKGYQILDKNYYFRIPGNLQRGEIDIVAKREDIICFFEVKTLKEDSFISPEEKVNFSKQRKLRMTAESWLMAKKIPLNSKWQIDIIAIKIGQNKKPEIFHFENAISYA